MFSRIKTRVLNAVNLDLPTLPLPTLPAQNGFGPQHQHHNNGRMDNKSLPNKFAYSRPGFLQLLTQDELRASADHSVRPIIVPRDIAIMPWNTGYAECVNSGKSEWNEDQAAFYRHILSHPTDRNEPDLPYTYFGVFDGHAGYGAALAASHQFHHILHEKLVDVIDLLMDTVKAPSNTLGRPKGLEHIPHPISFHRNVSKDELIIGALEAAFLEMDALLAGDRSKYRNAGGCTALVCLCINGKLFVSNAGDSRAILCQRLPKDQAESSSHANESTDATDEETSNKKLHVFPVPFSFDHTPETERQRLMSVAQLNPHLMAGDYVAIEYAKRPMQRDLGKRVLYRQGTMKGWAYKTLTNEDLKMPILTGEGKRSRLLGTIGVTRGFGDHDLRALCTGLLIKPFLSPHPEVNYRDLSLVETQPNYKNEDGEYGVLVMATDGLWDVLDPNTVSENVFSTLDRYPVEKHRYTMAAQELVAKARGRANEAGHWRLADSKAAATVDDVSVLVIPVHQYYKEYVEWQASCALQKQIKQEQCDCQTNELNGNKDVHVSPAREVIEDDKSIKTSSDSTSSDNNANNNATAVTKSNSNETT